MNPTAPAPAAPSTLARVETVSGEALISDLPDVNENAVRSAAAPTGPAAPAQIAPPGPSNEEYEATAEGYLALGYPLVDGLMNGKGEWNADDTAEHDRLRTALADVLRSRGVKPTTPMGRFLSVVLGFTWKRLPRPNTSRLVAKYLPSLARLLGIAPIEKPEKTDGAPTPEKPSTPPPDTAPTGPRDPFAANAAFNRP